MQKPYRHFIVRYGYYFNCMEEEEGFEPPRALTPLSVFKTDPFSQTWVFLLIDMKYNTQIYSVCQLLCHSSMCQLFLGSVILSIFSAFYFCTLFGLPRLRLLACLLHNVRKARTLCNRQVNIKN